MSRRVESGTEGGRGISPRSPVQLPRWLLHSRKGQKLLRSASAGGAARIDPWAPIAPSLALHNTWKTLPRVRTAASEERNCRRFERVGATMENCAEVYATGRRVRHSRVYIRFWLEMISVIERFAASIIQRKRDEFTAVGDF